MKPRDVASVERVFQAVRRAHKRHPDMRVGQILVNAASYVPGEDDKSWSLFALENDDLVEAIADFVREKQGPRTTAG